MNYRILPSPSETQKKELRKSIESVGLKNPLVIDEFGNVIDGHVRKEICEEIGIDWHVGADVRIGLTDIEKQCLVIELNLCRRSFQLTKKKRDELIEIYLLGHPELSDEQIAGFFGVDRSTVNRKRKRLVKLHKLPKVEATIGKDGIKRKVGERNARLIVKSKKEYDDIQSSLQEVGDELHDLIRRPKKIKSHADRKRAIAELKGGSSHTPIDFRNIAPISNPKQ